VLPYLTGKVQESKILHPVIVIHQFGFVRSIALKVKELSQLFLDASHIMTQCFLGQQIALLRFAGRVTDHTGRAAHQCQRLMTATLEMT
jgi:hypothetical protein